MTLITFQDGTVVFHGEKVGTEQACCCDQPCCITSTNCTITVTVAYSNGQTRTNGQNQLNEDGNEIASTAISAFITDCNTVGFSHEIINDVTCNQGASKQQLLNCDICCESGVGCDCAFGSVVSENYAFNPNDPGGECDQTPDINYVTSITFTLTDCDDCPCNEFP